MRILLIRTATLFLLIAISPVFFGLAADGDDASHVRSDPASVIQIVQDEAKPAGGEVTTKAKEAPVENLNLEILAAPLQALFGLGGHAREPHIPVVYMYILIEELNFIQLVCSDLTPQQRPKIKWAAESSVKQVAKEVEKRLNVDMKVFRDLTVIPAKAMPEPRKRIREAISKALEETLSKDPLVRFKREATDRTAQRKAAAILCVVSRLDDSLFLHADQRRKINDQLSSNWKDSWEEWLRLTDKPEFWFPVMLDQYVVPNLNADQESAWRGLHKWDLDTDIWGGGEPHPPNDALWWGNKPGPIGGRFGELLGGNR